MSLKKSFLKNLLMVFGVVLFVLMVKSYDVNAADYYISNSGNNANSGQSQFSPWENFSRIPSPLQAGDRILLERGSIWNQPLVLSGSGTSSSYIEVLDYGTVSQLPRISLTNSSSDICVTVNEGSYWKIKNLDLRNARMGIYFRYISTINNDSIYVDNCYFYNMNCDTVMNSINNQTDLGNALRANNDEHVWPAAIFVGGRISMDSKDTKVRNIIFRNNTFDQCFSGISSDWYYADSGTGDAVSRGTTKLWWIENCTITGTTNGIFAISKASDSTITNVRTISGVAKSNIMGTTGAFLQNSYNITIQNSEFSYVKNNGSPDGCGIDFEGNNKTVTFKNNVVHDNEGAAILLCATFGPNKDITMRDNTFYNNCLRPYVPEGINQPSHNYEILSWSKDNTGWIINTGIYKTGALDWISPDCYVPGSSTQGFSFSNHRFLNYSTVSSLPDFWLWNTNVEGWRNAFDWGSLNVSGGYLRGISTGTDMRIESPDTFVNGFSKTHFNLKFFCTSGGTGQIFFKTETENYFSSDKVITFTYTPGSNDISLIIKASSNVKWKGVITGLRFDPTSSSGATLGIDHLSFQ